MGRGRRFDKKGRVRPKKTPSERLKRENVHRKRLVAMGFSEAAVRKLDGKQMRDLLKTPVKTRKKLAK